MDRLTTMRAFVAVADAEGFAQAARRLGMSPPVVTRAVAELEQRVGTRLLQRTTRVVRVTEAGTRFLADCRRILAEIDEAEASAAGAHAEPRGQLAVTASVMFGRMYVAPVVLAFLARYPSVGVRFVLLDRIADLVEEGLDVAVRIAHLPDSALTAVKIAAVRRVVCASPEFLARHGTPKRPADLRGLDTISFSPMPVGEEWTFTVGGRSERVRVQTRYIVNNTDVAVAAAVAGRGFARALSYQVAPELRDGRLKIVLEEFEPPPLPIHVVHAEGRRASARVRAFVDFAVGRLRAEKSLN